MDWEIMQVCHGKAAPLKRIKKGDFVIFYSSKENMDDKIPLQMFTAIAQATDDKIYQVKQFEGFEPFRRKVLFLNCEPSPIRPLIEQLGFIEDKRHWGFPFRYGLFQISKCDFDLIAKSMQIKYEERESIWS